MLLASCHDQAAHPGPGKAPGPDVVLELDGISVTRSEVADWYSYLDGLDPRIGHAFRDRQILEQHILPLKFAQRMFRQHRAELLANAEALVKVAPTLAELASVSKTAEDPKQRGYAPERATARTDVPLAMARAIFAADKLGQVQGPIETPQGFVVVANRKLDKGITAFEDRADPWIVLFNTHMAREFDQWWRGARETAGKRVTYVHPDFKDSLPDWIQP